MPEPEKTWKRSENADKYNSWQWRKLATAHKRANPLCVRCLEKGIAKPAEATDHVKAIRDGGDFLAWDNLQSLCKKCHFDKTMEEANARKQKERAAKGRGA